MRMTDLSPKLAGKPKLKTEVKLTRAEFLKLRELMTERDQLEKFKEWQNAKFIVIDPTA